MGGFELAGAGPSRAPLLDVGAVLVELDEARVGPRPVAVSDENIAIAPDHDIRRGVEGIVARARNPRLPKGQQDVAVLVHMQAEYEDLKGRVAYDVRVTWLDLTASDSSVKVAERNSAMLHGRRFCDVRFVSDPERMLVI